MGLAIFEPLSEIIKRMAKDGDALNVGRLMSSLKAGVNSLDKYSKEVLLKESKNMEPSKKVWMLNNLVSAIEDLAWDDPEEKKKVARLKSLMSGLGDLENDSK